MKKCLIVGRIISPTSKHAFLELYDVPNLIIITFAFSLAVFKEYIYQISFKQQFFFQPNGYVVVNFLSQVIFIFLLFLGMIMYANEV